MNYGNDCTIFEIIINYANNHRIILEINENGNFPLLYVLNNNNNFEMVKVLLDYAKSIEDELLMDYAHVRNIIIKMNKKDNYGAFLLLYAIGENNLDMVQLLIDNNIVLELNKKDKYGFNSISWAEKESGNKKKILSLLINYAKNQYSC
ncbi:hypothetical protein PIROE2DRAFT_3054 [Piromyces sp. E2]|nr:hypothetical protein PIROE2DRAFT_3054 [Piromyces sp. E2]|eukprot:OUM69157.1 hypothetical protein PIROE2DRAFT_3054 [Piromyces sp. E2]